MLQDAPLSFTCNSEARRPVQPRQPTALSAALQDATEKGNFAAARNHIIFSSWCMLIFGHSFFGVDLASDVAEDKIAQAVPRLMYAYIPSHAYLKHRA
jgi:hypothetical protein